MKNSERIRVLKSMQTTLLVHREALQGMVVDIDDDEVSLLSELTDALSTVQTHISAMEHAVREAMAVKVDSEPRKIDTPS